MIKNRCKYMHIINNYKSFNKLFFIYAFKYKKTNYEMNN